MLGGIFPQNKRHVSDMNGNEKDVLIFFNCNPVIILVVILNVRLVCSGDMKALSLASSGFLFSFFRKLGVAFASSLFPQML